MKGFEYRGVTSVDGPIVVVRRTENIFYNETVSVRDRTGAKRLGRVIDMNEKAAVVQIFGSTTGIDLEESSFVEIPGFTCGIIKLNISARRWQDFLMPSISSVFFKRIITITSFFKIFFSGRRNFHRLFLADCGSLIISHFFI